MLEFFQPENIRSLLETAGIYAPLLFIFLQALQVIVAPIPMQVFGFAGGYAFGTVLGSLYSVIGLVIGSFVVLWLSRRYGRPLVNRFVSKSIQERFDSISNANGLTVLLLIFILPGLPDDAICFLAGLSTLKIRDILVVSALGRLPGIVGMSLIGDQVATGKDATMTIIVVSIVVLVVGLGYLMKDRVIGRYMPKEDDLPEEPSDYEE